MNKGKIAMVYWITTGLFAVMMLFSAIPNILMDTQSVKMIHEDMGYPLYFIRFIGVAKLLGVIGLLLPRPSRLKEWAYAGLFFDLVAAVYSFIAMGLPVADWVPMLVFILPGAVSYLSYHKKKKKSDVKILTSV